MVAVEPPQPATVSTTMTATNIPATTDPLRLILVFFSTLRSFVCVQIATMSPYGRRPQSMRMPPP